MRVTSVGPIKLHSLYLTRAILNLVPYGFEDGGERGNSNSSCPKLYMFKFPDLIFVNDDDVYDIRQRKLYQTVHLPKK
jgi:hypothetical protein